MKSTFLFIITFISLISCSKESESIQLNSPNDSTLLPGKWNLIQETLTNPPPYYINSLGLVPTPGNYLGKAGDYYNFKSNGTLVVHANNNTDSTLYSYQNGTLVIKGSAYKNLKILTFTASKLTFECRDTSSNGGAYYHFIDLQK